MKNKQRVKKVAIFASGTGTNARKIIEYFKPNDRIQIVLIVSNRSHAPVLRLAQDYNIAQLVLKRSSFYHSESVLGDLRKCGVDFIILAGFLWLIPPYLVKAYKKRMLNIHPALLPKYGGKGMYGKYVHQAVKAADERESGISIHYVNEKYDEGDIVFQARCALEANDSPEDIAKKVQQLEHRHFAPVIERVILSKELKF